MEAITMQDMIDYMNKYMDGDRTHSAEMQKRLGYDDAELMKDYMGRIDDIHGRGEKQRTQAFAAMKSRSDQFVDASNWFKVVEYANEKLS